MKGGILIKMKIVRIMAALITSVILLGSFTACMPKKVEDTRPSMSIDLRVYSDKVNIKSGDGKDDLFLNPVVMSKKDYEFRYEEGTSPTVMDVFKDVFDNHPTTGKATYTQKVDFSLDTVTMGTKNYKESSFVNEDNFKVIVVWIWDLNGVEQEMNPNDYKVKDGDKIRFYFTDRVSTEKVETEEPTETEAEPQ